MPHRPTALRLAAALVAAVALTACEIPSGVPRWDTTWNVPSRTLTVGVAQVLPSGVTVAPDGTSFLVSVAPVTFTQRLASDCAECASLSGFTAAKPAFVSRVTSSTPLPASVASGTLTAGSTVDVRVVNNYTFDPIRPNGQGSAVGYLTLVLRSGQTVLARDSVDGATAALSANGGVLTRRVTLAAGTVSGEIQADLEINSPAGSPALIDVSRSVVVTATPSALRVAQARVSVQGAQLSESTTTDLDVSAAITDRAQGGRLLVDVRDPFGVRGALRVRVTAPGVDFTKDLTVTGGDKSYAIEFSRGELQAMFGKSVTFTFAGPVSTAGQVTVTPSQAVQIGTRLELTLSTNS